MAKFNKGSPGAHNKTLNYEGGEGYIQDPRMELVSNLVTSFVADQFYRTAEKQMEWVRGAVAKDPFFSAQAAIYARDRFHMRSITHVVAADVAKVVKGEEWSRRFFEKVVMRPDDATEILARYLSEFGKPIPNSLKKGLGNALHKFDEYQLAKYKAEGKAMGLVDVVNLCRPKPTEALDKLMKGTLTPPKTWEVGLTQAGQDGRDKAEVWSELIREGRLGYMALLRNLRNILEVCDQNTVATALGQLINVKAVTKSKVLPFRFTTAHQAMSEVPGSQYVLAAIEAALDLSVANVPEMPGNTIVMLDDSGSMMGKPMQIGSLFAAVMVKAWGADCMRFSSRARWETFSPNHTTIAITNALRSNPEYAGTDFSAPFALLNKSGRKYDRIVLLSDMQAWQTSWGGRHTLPNLEFEEYVATNGRPQLYSWDLAGYGTLQFPEKQIYCLVGFSDHVFDVMALLESDREAMLKEIMAIVI